MKLKDKKEVAIIIAIVIIQTIVFIIAGANKSYIHMDETYSLGLANYDKVEIQANSDFYNQWHSKEYYEDYLAVQNKDIGKYSQVYENIFTSHISTKGVLYYEEKFTFSYCTFTYCL